jgi:hypothetical protein
LCHSNSHCHLHTCTDTHTHVHDTRMRHTVTSTTAEQARGFVQGKFAAMRQALDAKEKEVVQAIKQHSEAKLKALDMHREHLEMIMQCVRTMVQQCGALVGGGDGDKVRHTHTHTCARAMMQYMQ